MTGGRTFQAEGMDCMKTRRQNYGLAEPGCEVGNQKRRLERARCTRAFCLNHSGIVSVRWETLEGSEQKIQHDSAGLCIGISLAAV